MKKENWVWMPHAGHFICGSECRFRLNTYVGGFIVSTIGELIPDSQTREIICLSKGIKLEGKGDERLADFLRKNGYDTIGHDRTYETMVFKAGKSSYDCCPYRATDFSGLDFRGYNDAKAAYDGHLAMCEKWAKEKS